MIKFRLCLWDVKGSIFSSVNGGSDRGWDCVSELATTFNTLHSAIYIMYAIISSKEEQCYISQE